jgi:hypothetical protein
MKRTKQELRADAADRQRRYKKRHPDRVRENWRRYRATSRGSITQLLNNAKDRAKREGVDFNLTREWVEKRLNAGICELTGLSIQANPVSRGLMPHRAHPNAASIDRKQAGGPYTEENCRMVCFAINQALSDFGEELFFEIARAFVKKKEATK